MIVLDTHVWIWWVDNNPSLKQSIKARIDAENDIRVSAISLLEIATAVALNRLSLHPTPDRWLAVAQTAAHLRIEPLTSALCLASASLPGKFHRDPADRLIVALSRSLDCELVTADRKILEYSEVRTISAL